MGEYESMIINGSEKGASSWGRVEGSEGVGEKGEERYD